MADVTFAPGQTITITEIWRDKVWAVRPVRVVEDTDERLLLWCPKGTIRKVPTGPPSRPRLPTRAERLGLSMELCDWVLIDHTWDVDTLWFVWPGAWHAVWVSWFEPGVHWGWYGNLQEPFRRTGAGIETMDMMLDVLVERDGSWRWKDEDDFAAMLATGVVDEATAAAVRAAGHEVVRMSEAGEAPFCEPWPSWRPDPGWAIPTLPDDWDEM
jgi:hypothetical protein